MYKKKRTKRPFLVLVLMLALALLVAAPAAFAAQQANRADQTENAKSGSASNSASVSGGADSNQCAQILQASNSGNQQSQQDVNQYQNTNEASGQVSGRLGQGDVSQGNSQSIDVSPEAVQKCQQALAAGAAADPSSSVSSTQEEGKDKKDNSANSSSASSSSSGDTTTSSSSSDKGGGPTEEGKETQATGVITSGGVENYLCRYKDPYCGPPLSLTDEVSGKTYALRSSTIDYGTLSSYRGKRVTVSGYAEGESALRVTRVVELADGGPGKLQEATFTFELTSSCQLPEGAAYFAIFPGAAAPVELTPNSSSDGTVYTASRTFPTYPEGPFRTVADYPVQIVEAPVVTDPGGNRGAGGPFRSVKDFGSVRADKDKTLSASDSSCELPGDGTTTTGDHDGGQGGTTGGSGSSGGSSSISSGSSASTGAGGGSGIGSLLADEAASTDSNNGASSAQYQQYSGFGNDGSPSAISSGKSRVVGAISGVRGMLPMTGGAALPVVGVGILLIAGGLLVRRIFR